MHMEITRNLKSLKVSRQINIHKSHCHADNGCPFLVFV